MSLHDQRARADQGVLRDADRVAQRRVDTDEAALRRRWTWPETTTCELMKQWSPIDRVVADVVAAPERDVVADLDERLDRVVFQDEAVVAGRMLASERCSGC